LFVLAQYRCHAKETEPEPERAQAVDAANEALVPTVLRGRGATVATAAPVRGDAVARQAIVTPRVGDRWQRGNIGAGIVARAGYM
jgi:hypothetical protein